MAAGRGRAEVDPVGTDTRLRSMNSTESQGDPMTRLLVFSTLGHGSNEETRIRELLRQFRPEVFPFDRARKLRMFWRLLRAIRRARPDLVVMEGTGLAGGASLILA